ncbi:synergin gamma-like [Microplitis demolitor]|uniref:synergin gamma-like n=1 Tax=Microplitis demolitor TaxID=69319 RepID=UPI0004CD6D03|nr:synergin gamma-like [Microplitis demolitor]
MNKTRGDKKSSQLPAWLWPTSNVLPPMYRRVWDAVKEDRLGLGAIQGELLVDTNKVFPLLLTSQLPTEVLGYIWSLANQKYAGQLTEQELYIVLALTAIAQTSYAFTNLDVLHMLPGPPIPRLNLNILLQTGTSVQSPLESSLIGDFDGKRDRRGNKNFDVYSTNVPAVNSVTEPRVDQRVPGVSASRSFADDKLNPVSNDSKSHNFISSSVDFNDDFTEFQSAPITSHVPSILKLDSKQGSAIGSRLANHNLSGGISLADKKKSSSSKNNSSNGHMGRGNLMGSPVINKDRIDNSNNLFSKCVVKNQASTVILKDTIIRSSSEQVQQMSSSSSSREINGDNISVPVSVPVPVAVPVSVPVPVAVPVPAPVSVPGSRPEISPQDLMSLQPVEDKYSALRVLVEEPPKSAPEENPDGSDLLDDFGDFVSAEQTTESFDTAVASVDDSMDLFSDFEQFLPSVNDKSEISFAQETIEAFAQLEITASPEKTINFLEEKYEVTIDPEKVMQKEDTISVSSIDIGNGTVLTRSNSVPSLDLKSFLPANAEEDKEAENMHQLIYWEWKQYMESCVLLLQVAANIFTSINSETVLQEVLNSAQGYNFLCNLAEVAGVCRRVNFSHKEMDINIMGFDDLLMEIDKIWAEMEPFYANIPIVTELPAFPQHQNHGSACALCLTIVTSDKIVYNENIYHVTCANLWLNCVNNTLPALRYVPSHGHAITAGGSQI